MEQELLPVAAPEWLLRQTDGKTPGGWKKKDCCEMYPDNWKKGDAKPPIVIFSIRDCECISTAAILNLCSEVRKSGGLILLIAAGSKKASHALQKLVRAADGWLFWKEEGSKGGVLAEQTAQVLKRILTPDKNSLVGFTEEEMYWIFHNVGRLRLASGTGKTPQQAADMILQQADLRNARQLAMHFRISVQGSLEENQKAVRCLVQAADPSAEGVWKLTPEKDFGSDESRIELLFGQANMKGEEV